MLSGDLTIHGVTRRVSVPLDVQLTGATIEVVGALTFNWDLFGIKAPNLAYVTVESTATLEFRLLFAHATA
ncbi:MAG: YceI family protein [Acidimicrobiales bacterium]